MTSHPRAVQDGAEELSDEAYMFRNNFYPNAQFRVVSEQLEFVPVPPEVGTGQLFTNFHTRIIQYVGAKGQFAFLFPYTGADIEQGVSYRLAPAAQDIDEDEFDAGFGEGEEAQELANNLVNVEFGPAGEEL